MTEREPITFSFSHTVNPEDPLPIQERALRSAALLAHHTGWAITRYASEGVVRFAGVRVSDSYPLPPEAEPAFQISPTDGAYGVWLRLPSHSTRLGPNDCIVDELRYGVVPPPLGMLGWRFTAFNFIQRSYWVEDSAKRAIATQEGAATTETNILYMAYTALERTTVRNQPLHPSYSVAWA